MFDSSSGKWHFSFIFLFVDKPFEEAAWLRLSYFKWLIVNDSPDYRLTMNTNKVRFFLRGVFIYRGGIGGDVILLSAGVTFGGGDGH